jgi:hypothetical protein
MALGWHLTAVGRRLLVRTRLTSLSTRLTSRLVSPVTDLKCHPYNYNVVEMCFV